MKKRNIKNFEILTYLCYGLVFIINLAVAIATKDVDNLVICIWIFNATIMFTLYRQESKLGDESVAWRDELIKKQFKLILNIYDVIDNDIEEENNNERDKAKIDRTRF